MAASGAGAVVQYLSPEDSMAQDIGSLISDYGVELAGATTETVEAIKSYSDRATCTGRCTSNKTWPLARYDWAKFLDRIDRIDRMRIKHRRVLVVGKSCPSCNSCLYRLYFSRT